MQKIKDNIVVGMVVIIWFAMITILYFVTHKPFTSELAMSVSLITWRLIITGFITAIAGGLGLRLMKDRLTHPLALMGVSAALGFGFLALMMMVIGLLNGFRWFILIALLLSLAIFFRAEIWRWLKLADSIVSAWKESNPTWRIAGVIMGVMVISSLSIALAPPLKYDALMYHLTMPAAYLRAGGLEYLPWLAMSGMPQTTEMLYTLAMALGGDAGATVLGWWFAMMALIGLFGYLRHKLDNPSAWVGVASLMAGYTFVTAMSWGYVDWLGLLFGMGGLIFLDQWRLTNGKVNLAFSGIFIGFAFSTKYTAGILAIVLAVVFLWHTWRSKRSLFPNAFYFGISAMLGMLPWLIRNWGMTGNPLYPFFFPAGAMDPIRIAVYQGLPAWGDWRDLFLLPFQATYMGVDGRSGYSVSIGPILLGLGALAWVNARKLDRDQLAALETAGVAAIAGLLVWSIGNQFSGYLIQTRMYFSIFPSFAVLAAFGFHGISQLVLDIFRPARIVTALLFMVLGLNLVQVITDLIKLGAIAQILGIKTKDAYLSANLGWYDQAVRSMEDLPEGSQVVMLYEPRGFYCLPDCEPDEILDRWKHDLAMFGDPQTVMTSWDQQGFGYILYNRGGTEFLRMDNDPHHPVKDIDVLEQMLEGLNLVKDFGGIYQLYRMP